MADCISCVARREEEGLDQSNCLECFLYKRIQDLERTARRMRFAVYRLENAVGIDHAPD